MNKIVNVEKTELEVIKQMAMEIALRLNVLQGESLLASSATPQPPVGKASVKKMTKNRKLWIGTMLVAVVFGCIAANLFNQPIIFGGLAIMLAAEEIFKKVRGTK